MAAFEPLYTSSDMVYFCQMDYKEGFDDGYLKGYDAAHRELHRNFDIAQQQSDAAMRLTDTCKAIRANNVQLRKERLALLIVAVFLYLTVFYVLTCMDYPQIAPAWMQSRIRTEAAQ